MKLAVSLELYEYWNALRAGRGAPERNAIEPGAIRGVLADTFVLDFDDKKGFPFRIAGSRANTLFLRELRGSSFLQLWREDDRQEISSVLHCAADGAQPFLLGAETRPPGMGGLGIEMTLLPLRHHGLTHSRILGSIATGDAPQWLGFISAGQTALTSLHALDPISPRAGVAEPPGSFSLPRHSRVVAAFLSTHATAVELDPREYELGNIVLIPAR